MGWPMNDQSHISTTGTTSHDSASTGPHRGRLRTLAAAKTSSPSVTIASGVATTTGRKFGSKPADVSAWTTCRSSLKFGRAIQNSCPDPRLSASTASGIQQTAHAAIALSTRRQAYRRHQASATSCAGSAKIAT